MSQVINIEDHYFAVELRWMSLIGRDAVNRKIARAGKRLKARRYVRHAVNRNIRGLVAEDDIFGFYAGKVPKLKGKQKKVYALASVFARAAEAHSIWVFGVDSDTFLAMISKNGNPILDEIYDRKALIEKLFAYRNQEKGETIHCYVSGEIDEGLHDSLATVFGQMHAAPDLFTAPDEKTRLASLPSAGGIWPMVGMGAAAILLFNGYQMYREHEARIEAAKHQQTPDQIYRVSRDQQLTQTGLVSVGSFLRALREKAEWKESIQPMGWMLNSVECTFALDMVTCTRTWKRQGGTLEDLAQAIKKPIEFASLEVAKDSFNVPVRSLPINDLQSIEAEQVVQTKWAAELQRLKELSTFSMRRNTNAATEKKTALLPEMGKTNLIGTWPAGVPAANTPNLVKAGTWSVKGGLSWMPDLEALPGQFLVTKFVVTTEGGAAMDVSGLYLVRP